MKVNRLDPPQCEMPRRENSWRGKLIALLLGVGGTVVAIKACPSAERAPSTATANNRATTVRQREPYRFVTSGSHNPLRASRLFPAIHVTADDTGRPLESEIEMQRALMHRLLDEAAGIFNDYHNRGELAASDVEVAMATGVATDYSGVRTLIGNILQSDYNIPPPNVGREESIDPWSMSTQVIQDRMDEWALDLDEHGHSDAAIERARAGGSIGLAVRLSMEADRPEIAVAAIEDRLDEIYSDEQWRSFFLSALRNNPELLLSIFARLSVQQKSCALEALTISVQLFIEENTRYRAHISASSSREEIDFYTASIAENENLITRYERVRLFYVSE